MPTAGPPRRIFQLMLVKVQLQDQQHLHIIKESVILVHRHVVLAKQLFNLNRINFSAQICKNVNEIVIALNVAQYFIENVV